MGGLRYETGRDMPPGMQELAAVKLAQQLQEAAALVRQMFPSSVTAEAATPSPQGEGVESGLKVSNGDRIRALSNEDLAQKLFWVYQMTSEHDCGDIANSWCDEKGGCCGAAGEVLDCDEEKHKACILRWLQSEVAADDRIG